MTVTQYLHKCIINIIVLPVLCALLFIHTIPAHAVNDSPVLGHKYSNGVSNLTVWLNYASGVSIWEDYIVGGVNNWMYTGWNNPVYMNYVSSDVGSNLDFHAHANLNGTGVDPNALAYTIYFLGDGTQISPYLSDWYYAEVHINNSQFLLDSFSNNDAYGTVRHEIGHALGLDENNSNQYSIMCQYGAGRQVYTVQQCDNNSVVNIYQ